jgi:hypothetical protein
MKQRALAACLASVLVLAAGMCAEPSGKAEAKAGDRPSAAKAPPALTDEQRQGVLDAIQGLGHEDFGKREAASQAILRAGPAALPLLEAKLKEEHTDAERQSRLARLIEELKCDAGGDPAAELARALATKVSFEFAETPAEQVMQFFASLCGTARVLGVSAQGDPQIALKQRAQFIVDPALAQAPISLRVNDMSLDVALEWVAKLLDAKVVKSGNTVKLAPKP